MGPCGANDRNDPAMNERAARGRLVHVPRIAVLYSVNPASYWGHTAHGIRRISALATGYPLV